MVVSTDGLLVPRGEIQRAGAASEIVCNSRGKRGETRQKLKIYIKKEGAKKKKLHTQKKKKKGKIIAFFSFNVA